MEGEFDFMNFNFNQEMNIDEELPFGNWSEAEKYNNSNDNFFSFLKINYNSSPDTEKKFLQGPSGCQGLLPSLQFFWQRRAKRSAS